MLKIKDNVDLKKIGKDYNLDLYEYEESGLKYESLMLDDSGTQIVVLDEIDNEPIGIITNPEDYAIGYDSWDILYDLIEAKLVEKVGK